MKREELKQAGIHVSLATVGSMIPILIFVWVLLKPAVVMAVGEQLQEQVQVTVSKEVAPITVALGVILKNNIENIRLQIAAMEFRRDFPPADDWTDVDATTLARLKNDLISAEAALTALDTNGST